MITSAAITDYIVLGKGQLNRMGRTGDGFLWQISHLSVYPLYCQKTLKLAANHLHMHFWTLVWSLCFTDAQAFMEHEYANSACWAKLQQEAKQWPENWNKKKRKCWPSVATQVFLLIALCLHGAHILRGEGLSSLFWPDLFTLPEHLLLHNTYKTLTFLIACTLLHHSLHSATFTLPLLVSCFFWGCFNYCLSWTLFAEPQQ